MRSDMATTGDRIMRSESSRRTMRRRRPRLSSEPPKQRTPFTVPPTEGDLENAEPKSRPTTRDTTHGWQTHARLSDSSPRTKTDVVGRGSGPGRGSTEPSRRQTESESIEPSRAEDDGQRSCEWPAAPEAPTSSRFSEAGSPMIPAAYDPPLSTAPPFMCICKPQRNRAGWQWNGPFGPVSKDCAVRRAPAGCEDQDVFVPCRGEGVFPEPSPLWLACD